MLDPVSSVPLHAQVAAALIKDMTDGSLAPGVRLPSEEELIKRFSVSRSTIRTAIQGLVAQGQVRIHHGRGTFATRPVIAQELIELSGFVGISTAPPASIFDRRVVAASETVARQLAVTRGAAVARIQCVRLGEGVPLCFDEIYLRQELGEKILSEDLTQQPILTLMQRYAPPLREAEYRLASVAAHDTVARALQIAAGRGIFLIERTTFTYNRTPVDYERLYIPGDHVRLVTRLSGQPAARS